MIHPVTTSIPHAVRNRSRNGLAGIGSTVKQPISSIGPLVIPPVLSFTSSVPPRGGMTWPSRQPSVTSSSMDRPAEVKVTARMEAVSDRTARLRAVSVLES